MQNYSLIQKANPTVQKLINISLVFHYLSNHSPCHRAQISRDLNLSFPVVSRAVGELLQSGDIIQTSKIQLANGKKVSMFKMNADRGYILAVDLFQDPLKIVLADFDGRILKDKYGFQLQREEDINEDLIKELDLFIKACIQDRNCSMTAKNKIKMISLGIPATIDKDSGKVLGTQLYDYMLNKNYVENLNNYFNIPVYAENITNLSAIAEKRLGKNKNYDDTVFIEIGSGVGMGIFIQGKLYTGAFGAAGEIGYSLVTETSDGSAKHQYEHLEHSLSLKGIARMAVDAGLVSNDLKYTKAIEKLFELAKSGIPEASAICDKIIENLSTVFCNIVLILNPQQIVVGGSITTFPLFSELVIAPLKIKVNRFIPFGLPRIEISSLKDDSGILGAVYMGIEKTTLLQYPYHYETLNIN